MEYEGYHLVSLIKEAAENACTQLFIIAFLKNKKENSKMIYEIELNFLLTECSHSLKLDTVKI